MKTIIKLFLVALISTTAITSCSKSDNASPSTTTSTFTVAYNGTYTGSAVGAAGPTTGDLILTVTGPTTATVSGVLGDISITGIAASSGTAYTGNSSSGAISLGFTGAGNKTLGFAVGPYTFNGSRP